MKTVRYLMLFTLLTSQVRGDTTITVVSKQFENQVFQFGKDILGIVKGIIATPQEFAKKNGTQVALGVTGGLGSYLLMSKLTHRYFGGRKKCSYSDFMPTISFMGALGFCGLGSCELFADCNPFADCGPWGYYAPAAVGVLGLLAACEGYHRHFWPDWPCFGPIDLAKEKP